MGETKQEHNTENPNAKKYLRRGKIKINMTQIQRWELRRRLHNVFSAWELWNTFRKKTTRRIEYIPGREHNTYTAVRDIAYKDRLHILEDYETAYEKENRWK